MLIHFWPCKHSVAMLEDPTELLASLNARNYIKRQSSAVAAIEALQSEPSPGITIPKV